MSTTHVIRISERAHHELKDLAAQLNQSMQALIEQAIEEYKRKRFFEQANLAYAKLKEDPVAWEEVRAERALWEDTIADGLEKE
jgi:restriction endonuclease S subunit